jgi:hypothetical protein
VQRVLVGLVAVGMVGLGALPVARTAPAPPSGAADAVIVVLKNQYLRLPASTRLSARRDVAVASAERPVITSLRGSGALRVRPLHLLDAVAATVSAAEAARLAADPSVAEVAPDAVFRGPSPVGAPKSAATAPATNDEGALPAGVCPAPGQVQLDPEGVEAVDAVSPDPAAPTARKLGFTGAGVTVGDIAVGIDPDTKDLVRPDGQPVIAHYVDFTGEGTAVQSVEDLESYLDDSVMAAQGRVVYDLHSQNPALPRNCDIRLEGVAPGITLDAYKVYGQNDATTTSAFLEAIDYAVTVDHVNVLNEEGGSFPMPDTSQDLIKTANDAALAAGTTITSPSYDAGQANTIWSPSSEQGVLSVGASTVFRSYAQDDVGGFSQIPAHGWVSDNISALSSGGSTEEARSIDLVAPGDLDWITCQSGSMACPPTGLTLEGGTSEAGPIVAAVAALVIQAYRSAHQGATPTASQVRDIVTSSATDLDAPASAQGAGLVDAYRAVRTAEAAPGSSAPGGPVADSQQLDAIGAAGSTTNLGFSLNNEGGKATTVRLGGRTLGPAAVVLDKTFQVKGKVGKRLFTFDVPHPAGRLEADIAFPGGPDAFEEGISLVDPLHRLTAYSLPQGEGNHGRVDVHNAAAGTWTGDLDGRGYTGPVHVEITTASFVRWGSVSPSSVRLAPHATVAVHVHATLPSQAGDQSAAVTWSAPGAGDSSLPVTLRALVPIVDGVGHFAGSVVGGNGRGGVPAQTLFYNFMVGPGHGALDVATRLEDDQDDPYYAYLVAPDGAALAQASSQLLVGFDNGADVVTNSAGARLHTLAPAAGRWTLIVTFANPVAGKQLATPFEGTVDFAPESFTATGLPDSITTSLLPGHSRLVTVKIHNDGTSPESYFLDSRLDHRVSTTLASITPSQKLTEPASASASYPQWIVPAGTTALTARATSSAPTTFDWGPYNGDPDLGATVSGDHASATVTGGPLTPGDWYVEPQRIGPFAAKGASPSTSNLSLVATTRAFDRSVSTSTGDLWEPGPAQGADFTPVVVQPGQTTTAYAMIVPHGTSGTVVHGVLYLDDTTALTNGESGPSGDELAVLPYAYRIG